MNSSNRPQGLLVLSGSDVRRALPMSDCIEAIDTAMRTLSAGGANVPLRTIMLLPDRNFFGVMPGALDSPRTLGAKVLTVFPGNGAHGLPSHVGLVILFDSGNGFPLAVMDAAQITAIRTAAASAVATRALARADACHLGIVGTGTQAVSHLEAIAKVRQLKSVQVWGRSGQRTQEFAQRYGERLSLPVRACSCAEEAVRGMDIVCTVTASHEPVVSGQWLTAGAHVNLVGASRQTAREVDDELVVRSSYFVDSRTSARAEAGELKHAIDAGLVTAEHLRGEIGEVLAGTVRGRSSESEITVYKSLGIAAQDLAAAHVVYERAMRDGIGTRAPF